SATPAADLAYLEDIPRTAEEAAALDLSPREAQLAVYSVEPPRKNLLSLEIYEQRNNVSWRALREAREQRASGEGRFEALWQRFLDRTERLYTSSGVLPDE